MSKRWLDTARDIRYYKGMKSNTKSSITLPPNELKLVNELMKKLDAKSKVEVIRRGLQLLKDTTDREELRKAYAYAVERTRPHMESILKDLEGVDGDGLDGDNDWEEK